MKIKGEHIHYGLRAVLVEGIRLSALSRLSILIDNFLWGGRCK